MTDSPSDFTTLPLVRYPTVFHRLSPVGAQRAFTFWFVVFLVAVLISILVSVDIDNPVPYRALCTFVAAGLITVPLVIHFCYAIFLEWARHIDEFVTQEGHSTARWFATQMRFVEGSWQMGMTGLVLGLLAILAYHAGGYLAGYPLPAVVVASLIVFASSASAGAGLFAMYCVSRNVWLLGSMSGTRVSVQRHRFGILSTGSTLVKAWMLIGCVWAVFVLSAVVGLPSGASKELWTLPPMWLLAYPTFPLIVGSFIVCQLPLHRRMVEHKRSELHRIDRMLEISRAQSTSSLDDALMSRIEFLGRQKEELRRLPEWPFSLRALLGTGASSITALLPVLVTDVVPNLLQSFLGISTGS